jgi:hypothetical protein
MNEDRYVCTKENPWEPGFGRAMHPDAKYLKDKDYGDGECTEVYHCPNCDLTFECEIAQ